MEEIISIGKVLNFHGIKGEVKVGFSKGRENQIEKLKKVLICSGKVHGAEFNQSCNDYKELTVSNVRFHKHFAIIKFKEINTVNEVEEIKGSDIYLTKSEVEKNLDNDEYLIKDLIGMEVYDEDGCNIGTIDAVGENIANNIISVKDGNGKSHLVPFVKELVPVVDIKGKKIVVNNIEGLIS